jgi:glycine betaine/proline transport system permease protein
VPFLIVETIAFVQIALGLFGDLASQARDRIASIEGTLELRRQQLQAAIEAQSDKVDVYKRTVESLEDAIGGIGWKRSSWKTRASGLPLAASRCCW